ncbi:hypothetical protein WH91_01795 [Devosia psychrophila]|nr:hypothetical protein WH91_01795 [Devosia psychrophila]
MSDAAWDGLQRCARIYAMSLNHEYAAAPLSEQVQAVKRVSAAAGELLNAIEAANTQANGRAVSNNMGEAWATIYDREAEHDRNVNVMVEDLCQVMSEDDAWSLVRSWYAAGRILRPEPVADTIIHLGELATAARLAYVALENGTAPSTTKGGAFQEFIGVMYEWKAAHRITAGVNKGSANSAGGRLTRLVKAILDQVPILKDDSGKALEKQMRRAVVADGSLAEAIGKARDAYEANRPAAQRVVLSAATKA